MPNKKSQKNLGLLFITEAKNCTKKRIYARFKLTAEINQF
jgi:hypothetical protein